ncbi:MAG: helix-turn-helix domain-containing protein [Treponema sp.]|nr:helix-turn-helix domain-containing protein [Treponema sp.]
MQSFGEILRTTREEKNLDIDKISREISIEKRYLIGLEEEDNSAFPGEAYMVGFLRNYSNYLELNTDLILKLYNNKKIQESPVPEGLIIQRKKKWVLPLVLSSVAVVIVAALVVVFVLLQKNKKVEEGIVVDADSLVKKQYELTNTKFLQRVYKGDQLIIPTEKSQIVLTVYSTLSSFGLETPAGVFYVELGEESEIDVNGDGTSELILYVDDLSMTDEKRGARISVLLSHGINIKTHETVDVSEITLAQDVKSKHTPRVILEETRSPYPFTLNAIFRGSCLFRDKVDSAESVETYFTQNETFTATPKNGIRLWISNSNNVKFTILADSRSFELDIGPAGQVLVEDIKWIKDTDGKYKLVVIELD